MDSLQISKILTSCPLTKKRFKGVHPYDHVNQCIKKATTSQLKFWVFNTEESNSPGLHWILIVTEGKKAEIFDSLSFNPQVFYNEIVVKLRKLKFKTILKNPFRVQQFSSTVCGHHVIYYALLKCLNISRKDIFSLYYRKNAKYNDKKVKQVVEQQIFKKFFTE